MHEKDTSKESAISSIRSIDSNEPVFLRRETLKQGEVAIIGSLYLGDASNADDREGMDASGLRLDIIDLRSAPIEEGGKMYAGQIFGSSIDYLVVQGQPDWEKGTGFKGLRKGESLTIGRTDPVSSKRFQLGSPLISRSHATLSDLDGGLVIEDNGSANGTMYAAYDRQHAPALGDTVTAPASGETTAQTESNLARAMSDTEVAHWKYYMNENKAAQYESIQELLDNPRLAPTTGVEIDNKTFLLSEILRSRGRKVAIGYVSAGDQPGKLMPRMFYQSESDGGWRSSPNIDDKGTLSKGSDQIGIRIQDEHGHYVQMTKPNESIVAVLERQDRLQAERSEKENVVVYKSVDYSDLMSAFHEDRLNAEQHSTYVDEVSVTKVDGRYMDAYVSGRGAHDSATLEARLTAMELPAGFEPDFTEEPSKQYHMEHTLAGRTGVEVYPAVLNGRAVEWHVAHDEAENRVWIDRIVYRDSKVTTYGTQSEVIVAGALSSKPFDYETQLGDMAEGRDWTRLNRSYVDVTPTLDRIPAIKHYRLSKGIYRKR